MKANREKWVKALRSGEYKQGRGALREGDKFCCLGVACDLYGKEKKIKWKRQVELYKFLEKFGCLPKEVMEWLGLKDVTGYYDKGYLTFLNDGGASFNEIADLIESEPIGLLMENDVQTN